MTIHRQRLLAGFYDPFAASGLREPALAARMFELAGDSPRRILHLGCGRGWLTRAFATRFPACEVIGLDADPDIVAGAEAGAPLPNLRFVLGRAEAPAAALRAVADRSPREALGYPEGSLRSRAAALRAVADRSPREALGYPEGSLRSRAVDGPFDAIVSSLLFHHVPRAAKRAAFQRAAELLVPGGQLLTVDFARPHDLVMRVAYLPVQFADGFDDTADNLDGSYVRMMTAAGLRDAREEGHRRTPLGTVALYRATA